MALINSFKKEETQFRNFQKDGILFILKNKFVVLGDATGLGKTIQILGAFTYYKSQYPDAKMILLTDKSIVKQIDLEVAKFFFGIKTTVVYEMEKEDRFKAYQDFFDNTDILVTNYGGIRGDIIDPEFMRCSINYDDRPKQDKILKKKGAFGEWTVQKTGIIQYKAKTADIKKKLKAQKTYTEVLEGKDNKKRPYKCLAHIEYIEHQIYITLENPVTGWKTKKFMTSPFPKMIENAVKNNNTPFVMAFDEAEAFQDKDSITHKMGSFLSKRAQRVVAITATVSKGELLETYNVMKCIGIKLTPTKKAFDDQFCVHEENFAAGRMKWGPRKGKFPLEHVGYKNIAKFKTLMAPYYIGRAKVDVASELPGFSHKRYSPTECDGVKSAMAQLYRKSFAEKIPANMGQIRIASVTPQLIDESLPEDYISSPVKDLIHACNHSFSTEKLVVYLDYRSPIDLLEKILPKHMPKKYKNILKITGDVTDRQSVMDLFKGSPDHNIIFLNSAGRRGLNLQCAGDLWFLVDPYTGGDFSQIAGRISRIGTNQTSFTIHKTVIPDTVSEDVQVIIQSDLRVMQKLAPNSVDEGLIEPSYDYVSEVPDAEDFILKSFNNRAHKYITSNSEI